MKEVVLKVTESNMGMKGPTSWSGATYKIYDDLSVDIIDTYNAFTYEEPYKVEHKYYNCSINEEDYEMILENIELVKKDNTKVDACDGTMCEVKVYHNGLEIWKREHGYIYGIKPLEEITGLIQTLRKIDRY